MILPNWVETNYELDKSKINLRHKDRILSVGRLVSKLFIFNLRVKRFRNRY